MRKIKFRGWHTEGKEMVYMHQLPLHSRYPKRSLADVFSNLHMNWVLMQYSGVKDKEGAEIFEGDIIKTGDNKFRGVVEYESHCYHINRYQHGVKMASGINMYYSGIQVIGNIYENKDLLNER